MNLNDLAPRVKPVLQDHLAARHAKGTRQKLDQHGIGGTIHWQGSEPDLQCVAVQSSRLGPFCARLNVQGKNKTATAAIGFAAAPSQEPLDKPSAVRVAVKIGEMITRPSEQTGDLAFHSRHHE